MTMKSNNILKIKKIFEDGRGAVISVFEINTDINFNLLFDKHPKTRFKVRQYDKEKKIYFDKAVHRYSQSYLKTPAFDNTTGKSYMFNKPKKRIPLDVLKSFAILKDYNQKFNQITVNWYEAEKDYIDMHSDCPKKMIKDYYIGIINFTDAVTKDALQTIEFKSRYFKTCFKITLKNNLVIIFNKKANELYRHGVKINHKQARRISITTRMIK